MRVLICLDETLASEAVLDSLNNRDWPSQSIMRLVTVVPAAENSFANDDLFHSFRQEGNEKVSAERLLSAHAEFYARKLPHLKFSSEVLPGETKETLLKLMDDWLPDLVMVGTGGKRDFDPLMLGSISQAILEHARCPVQIAKKNAGSQSSAEQLIILVPLDHSPNAAAAIDWLLLQKWSKPAHIRLLSAIPPLSCEFTGEQDLRRAEQVLSTHLEMEDSSMRLLQKYALSLTPLFGNVSCELLPAEPRNAILDSADKCSADLILMGSHGLSGIQRFLLGSVSRHVSINAKCSVEIVRKISSTQFSQLSQIERTG